MGILVILTLVAALLLGVAAFFMITDSVQIVARGALQGLKDTTMPMVIALSTTWGVGLPTAVVLGFVLDFGGPGIWAGMAVAMAGAALAGIWPTQQYNIRDLPGNRAD